jgi:hypothetical protein
MAFDIDYFLKINNSYGATNKKEVQLYNLKSQINDRFSDTIDHYNVKINNVDRELLIIRTIQHNEKTIKSRPYEDFSVGDYVVFDNKTWMIISKDECNQAYTTGTMQLCNYTLKFQSPDGTILSYPCIDETTNSVGIDETNTINTLNGIHRIKLPFCLETDRIKVDDRFFIDKSNKFVYKITSVNNTEFNYSDKGLIVLTLKADSIQVTDGDKPKDRPDLGICNYFEPTVTPTPTPSPSGYTLTIAASGDFNLGTTRTLTPTLEDSLGNVVSSWTAVWSADYNLMTQSYFSITYVGNQCKIFVSDEAYDCIDGVLELTCTVSGNLVSATYSGTITT